jgi:hypothetical protein
MSEQANASNTDLFVSAREAWLYKPKLSPEARIVGLYLARRFEMSPEWHPRERDISERCGISIYAARKALIDLRAAGFMTGGEKQRKNGRWTNSPYRVTARLHDASIHWIQASENRNHESRTRKPGAIYSHSENHIPKDVQDQMPWRGTGKVPSTSDAPLGAARQHPCSAGSAVVGHFAVRPCRFTCATPTGLPHERPSDRGPPGPGSQVPGVARAYRPRSPRTHDLVSDRLFAIFAP